MTPEEIAERDLYLELNRNESRIISERLRGMLTFEGLLFAAASVSAGQRLFVLAGLLAVTGALCCWPWYYAVRISYQGAAAVGAEYNKRKPSDAPKLDAFNITVKWQFWCLPEVFIPVAVGVAWVLVVLTIIYYSKFLPPLLMRGQSLACYLS